MRVTRPLLACALFLGAVVFSSLSGHRTGATAPSAAPSDRILVDKLPLSLMPSSGWVEAVFRDPKDPSRTFIKRVELAPGAAFETSPK